MFTLTLSACLTTAKKVCSIENSKTNSCEGGGGGGASEPRGGQLSLGSGAQGGTFMGGGASEPGTPNRRGGALLTVSNARGVFKEFF